MLTFALASCKKEPQHLLPDYYGYIQYMHMTSFVPVQPVVRVGGTVSDEDADNGIDIIRLIAEVMANVRGTDIADELEERLELVVPPEEMSENLTASLTEAVADRMPITPVEDLRKEHDTRLEVEVIAYGIDAEEASTPAHYVMHAYSRLIYVPEDQEIWSAVIDVNEKVGNQPYIGGNLGQLIGTGVNMNALQGLEDEELQQVFDALASEVAASIADKMRRDSVR